MVARLHYFARDGTPISLEQWAQLWSDRAYRFVERTWIRDGTIEVVTAWNGFDPYRVSYDDGPPRIYVVVECLWVSGMVRGTDNETWHATEAEAAAAHAALVARLRATD